MQIFIGNIIALIASIVMISTGIFKQKNKILFAQTVQISLFVISNLVLGGFTGAIINIINLIRNILAYNNKLDLNRKYIIIGFSIVFCLIFNNLGFVGYLPLISTVIYICFITEKDIILFKWMFIYTVLLWGIYDLCIKSYTSAVFDLATIIATIVSIILIKKNKLNSKSNKKTKKNSK